MMEQGLFMLQGGTIEHYDGLVTDYVMPNLISHAERIEASGGRGHRYGSDRWTAPSQIPRRGLGMTTPGRQVREETHVPVLIRMHDIGDMAKVEFAIDNRDARPLAALLLEWQLTAEEYTLVAINGTFVSTSTVPCEGDIVDVFPHLCGG